MNQTNKCERCNGNDVSLVKEDSLDYISIMCYSCGSNYTKSSGVVTDNREAYGAFRIEFTHGHNPMKGVINNEEHFKAFNKELNEKLKIEGVKAIVLSRFINGEIKEEIYES